MLRLRRPESRAHAARRARQPWQLPLRIAPSPAARLATLALLLKFFFAPLMINWCLNHLADMAGAVVQLIDGVHGGQRGRALFDASLYWALFQCILFADTLLFTLGYIVEVPALRNRIRSVDPTFFGWFVCLACYPPFNDFTTHLFAWQSSDFPYFENDYLHLTANVVLLVAMAIYSWASIALGFKASNLTNRGIVSRGPYAVVRHPAYAAKNFAWWIGSLPAFIGVVRERRSAHRDLLGVRHGRLDPALRAARHHRGASPADGPERLRRVHAARPLALHTRRDMRR